MKVARPAEGLLEQIGEQALDDDYYEVRPTPPTRADRALTVVAAGLFGLMITVAAVQTQVDRPSTEREQQALADDVEMRQATEERRREQVNDLQTQVASLTAAADRNDPALRELLIRSAGVAVRGDGIIVTLAPAANDGGAGDVTFRDLRAMVNGLWALGAEAVSVNHQRLSTRSSIRAAGGGMTVNYVSIDPPYVIRAIGDPDDIEDRLADSPLGQEWEARAADTTLDYDVETSKDLRLPAIGNARLEVEHAKRFKAERVKESS